MGTGLFPLIIHLLSWLLSLPVWSFKSYKPLWPSGTTEKGKGGHREGDRRSHLSVQYPRRIQAPWQVQTDRKTNICVAFTALVNIVTNSPHHLVWRSLSPQAALTMALEQNKGHVCRRYRQTQRLGPGSPNQLPRWQDQMGTGSFHWNQGTTPSHSVCQVQSNGLSEGHTMNKMPYTQCHENKKLFPSPECHLENEGRGNPWEIREPTTEFLNLGVMCSFFPLFYWIDWGDIS